MQANRHSTVQLLLRRPLFAGALVIAPVAAAVLVACGGGGSTMSSPSSSPSQAMVSGTLTGFGSIFVNGTEYDDTNATITDDLGATHAATDLKLGMQVDVSGADASNSGSMGSATTVVFSSSVIGPVDTVDASSSSFTSLGQTIDVNVDTVWDPTLTGGLGGLTAGQVLRVFSLYDSTTNMYVATRIEPDTAATAYKLRGMISNLDTTAMTYTVGGTTIDYSGASSSAAASKLANGDVVTAELQTTAGSSGDWMATALQLHNQGMPGSKVVVHVRGMISAETSATSFTLEGWPIDASAATFPSGQSAIVDGAMVQVDGIVSNGAVVASQVALQQAGAATNFQVHGPIEGLHSNLMTFVLRGTTVSYSGTVNYTGGTAADLAIGTKVLVQGTLASDGNTVQAVNIKIGQ
jgi:hypothetical protein